MHSTATQPVPASTPQTNAARPTAELRHAILLTLVYGDLFDFPLDADELYRDLVTPCPERRSFDHALTTLIAEDAVVAVDGRLCLPGRESTAALRAERGRRAAPRWRRAERFAGWLARVPFVRAIGVCGSQAVDNPTADGDIDLFLITAPGRLWLAQASTMVLRRLARFAIGGDFCPNYLLAESALEIRPRNLYTAHEVAQVVPLWGAEAFDRFLDANRWTERFLPQRSFQVPRERLRDAPPGRPRAALERLLGGRLGTALDRLLHRVLVAYYALRLRRPRREVARAYRRDRQVVITGGYLGAVAARFVDRARTVLRDELEDDAEALARRTFAGDADGEAAENDVADPLYAELFARRYGGA